MNSIYNVQNWAINTNYFQWDIVLYNGLYYYSLSTHNSGLTFDITMWGGVTNWNGQNKPEFVWIPSYNNDIPVRPRTKNVQYGDGYKQVSPDGINNILLALNLTFDLRSESEARAILHFLHNMSGSQSFVFLPPSPYNINKLFICQDFSRTDTFLDNFTIKCVFEETIV